MMQAVTQPELPTFTTQATRSGRRWTGDVGRIVRVAVTVAACVLPACAGTTAGDPWRPYRAELGKHCPAKHLDWLSPADLRDALDTYQAGAAPRIRAAMAVAEADRCVTTIAGATCGNLAEIEAARSAGALPPLATSVCNAFVGCRGQSDCSAAEPPSTRSRP